jgi:hypothetical protein
MVMMEKMMAVMAETAAVTIMTAVEGMEKTAVMMETVAVVYQRGRWFVSSVSEVRIMWNITALCHRKLSRSRTER